MGNQKVEKEQRENRKDCCSLTVQPKYKEINGNEIYTIIC